MSKYDPLLISLSAVDDSTDRVTFTFRKVEEIIGEPLPMSARVHPEWWENDSSPNGHVQAKAWLGAGWIKDQVDLQRGIVHFRRIN